MNIVSWEHHYRAHNKMADCAANQAMDTRLSSQYSFPSTRSESMDIAALLRDDITFWFQRQDTKEIERARRSEELDGPAGPSSSRK